jgi:chemotaxis-related protein WspB
MLALTFQIHHDRIALDVRRISRVVPWVPLDRPQGSPAWLAGVFVYSQSVVPVIDLHRLLGAGECPPQLSSRIILVPWSRGAEAQGWLGLLAAHVSEIRDVALTDVAATSTTNAAAGTEPDLGRIVLDQGQVLRILDLDRLITPSVREHLAGVCAA